MTQLSVPQCEDAMADLISGASSNYPAIRRYVPSFADLVEEQCISTRGTVEHSSRTRRVQEGTY
jgi:hypothetical protein